MKDLTGIEPVTCRSAVGCSTTELKVREYDFGTTIVVLRVFTFNFEWKGVIIYAPYLLDLVILVQERLFKAIPF